MAHYSGAQLPHGHSPPLERIPLSQHQYRNLPEDDAPLDFSKKSTHQEAHTDNKTPQNLSPRQKRRLIEQHFLNTYGVNWRSYPGLDQAYEFMLGEASGSQAAAGVRPVPPPPRLQLEPRFAQLRVNDHLAADGGNREIASYQITTSNGSTSPPQVHNPLRPPFTAPFNDDPQLEPIPPHTETPTSISSVMSMMKGLNPLVSHSLLAHRLLSTTTDHNGENKNGKYIRPFKAYANGLMMHPFFSILSKQLQNESTNHSPSSSYVPLSTQISPPNREDTSFNSSNAHYDRLSNPDMSRVNSPAEPCGSMMPSSDNGYRSDQRCRSPNSLVNTPQPVCDSSGIGKSPSTFGSMSTNGDSNGSEEASSSHDQAVADTSNGTYRKKGRSLPEELKDDAYWERRRKNNQAAKRSRDQRRKKEDLMALQAAALTEENYQLNLLVKALRRDMKECEQRCLWFKEQLSLFHKMREKEQEAYRCHSRGMNLQTNPDVLIG